MLNNCHLSKLIHEQAAHYGDRTALSYRDYAAGRWIPVSWNEFAAKVSAVSRALLALGVKVQENVAVFSQNKPECFFTNFGIYGIRAVAIPFYATSSGAQVAYMVNDAAVRYIFVGEQEQYDTAIGVMQLCPTLEKIIIFDDSVKRKPNDNVSQSFADFLKTGTTASVDSELDFRKKTTGLDDTADILYTSGTTGASKGVILTYGMYHAALRANDTAVTVGEDDVVIDFLPITHVFERGWSYLCLAEGAQLAVNLRPTDILRSLQEVHPTCMCSVPRFWEKVYQGVLEKMDKSPAVTRKLIKNALDTGGRIWVDYRSKCIEPPLGLRLKYEFYNRTIIKVLRKTLGLEKANIFPTAGAAVSPEVEKFVHAAGINMIVGYGLTESTATVSCNVLGKPITLGSVGRLIEGLEIKFGENDEILLRGKTITPGYYKKETSTKEAITEDGWFHTGDAGYMKNGELFLKERIKDLFKTSNGKYIAPQMIESKLAIDKYIEQAVIVADKHKFVSALIVPDYRLLGEYAAAQGIRAEGKEALCDNPVILQMIGERIDTLQQDLAHYEKVKRFVLLPEAFTIENGELTNTLKVRRAVIYDHYSKLIEDIYLKAEAELQDKNAPRTGDKAIGEAMGKTPRA